MKTYEFCLHCIFIRTCSNVMRLERKYNLHFAVNNAQVFKCFPKLEKHREGGENFREIKEL